MAADRASEPPSDRQFRDIFEHATDGIVFMDGEGRIERLNPAAERFFGYATAEVVGQPFWVLTPDADHEKFRELFARYRTTGVGEYVGATREVRARRKDGSVVPVEISVSAGEADGRRWLTSMLRDVTERQATAEALRRSEESFRQLIDASPDAVGVYQDGKVVYTNPAAGELLGIEPGGRAPFDPGLVSPAADRTVLNQRLGLAIAGQPQPMRETTVRHRSGALRTIEVVTVPVVFAGKPAGLSVARDITGRKRLADEVQRADRLAVIGTMAASLAHEINNPLAYVLLNLERLLTRVEQGRDAGSGLAAAALSEVETLASQALDGVERVRRISRDLQAFARPSFDESAPVDVRHCLERAIDIASNEIRHRARLVREYRPVRPVTAEAGRLSQVFLNLLINACHAIPEGNADAHTITIVLRPGSGNEVVVEVRDTGVGIPPEHLARVFEPFYSTKPATQGTGLGLFVCQMIVAGFGGKLQVESRLHKGSCFRAILFAAGPDAAESPAGAAVVSEPVPQRTPGPAAPPSTPRARLLVIDDERLICEAVRAMLVGYEVITATNGRQGLRTVVEQGPFDLVLCDVHMPEMSGVDVYGVLQRTHPTLAARMVFLTGGTFSEKPQQFLAAVSNRVLKKPFRPEELAALIDSALFEAAADST